MPLNGRMGLALCGWSASEDPGLPMGSCGACARWGSLKASARDLTSICCSICSICVARLPSGVSLSFQPYTHSLTHARTHARTHALVHSLVCFTAAFSRLRISYFLASNSCSPWIIISPELPPYLPLTNHLVCPFAPKISTDASRHSPAARPYQPHPTSYGGTTTPFAREPTSVFLLPGPTRGCRSFSFFPLLSRLRLFVRHPGDSSLAFAWDFYRQERQQRVVDYGHHHHREPPHRHDFFARAMTGPCLSEAP